MTKRTLPEIEVLRQLLDYDPETGALTWKVRGDEYFVDGKYDAGRRSRRWNSRHAGKQAFSDDGQGYLRGTVVGSNLAGHRVAWALVNGYWPDEVDHINHDRADNRLANLREVSKGDNLKNRTMFSNNSSGVTGVSWHKQHSKWAAHIRVNGRRITLGVFRDMAEAVAARRKAEVEYGFHENHGR